MVIGIDIDSTITSTGKKTRECLQEFAPGYEDYHLLPEEQYKQFLDLYEEYIHINCELKSGVQEAFAYFKECGYKIVIITARDTKHCPNQFAITTDYFKRHNLHYDEIIFECEEKGQTASSHHVNLFIDDKEANLDDISAYGIECFRFGAAKDSKYKTFTNWYDIIEYLKDRG
ncbi:MAG: hypothetical protein K2J20_00545 [Bacilli bacterium]|nr:hypothetical protein [Bacilli bacterium]